MRGKLKRGGAALVAGLLCLCVLGGSAARADEKDGKVYVILWFDTEDYILPASDSATLRLARFLLREGIRAVFKIVGERALSFERRGRKDVIEALKKHEIGFHSRWHSAQPTPAVYLSDLGWDEGVAEFDRREKPGYDDVRRIFGQAPTCYGQPGSSWGPQSYGAMKKWGTDVYLDAGSHVKLGGKPFWYGGVLTLYHLDHTLRADLGSLERLKEAEDRFIEARKKLLAEGGGVVSIYYHPCEFVHKKFWDGVNFSKGANPPREEWKLPPTKTEEESRIAYEVFERYVRFIKRFPQVEFITATDALKLYRDGALGRAYSAKDLRGIARDVKEGVTFQRRGDYTLSAADVFALLNQDFVARQGKGEAAPVTLKATPTGPVDGAPALKEAVTTDWSQFTRTAADVQDYLDKRGRVPSTVWLGSVPVPPEAYLVALARVHDEQADGKEAPKTVEIRPATLAAAEHVAEDNPRLWGWVIFPPGFRAPAMMQLARRQAWTLKPALLRRAS